MKLSFLLHILIPLALIGTSCKKKGCTDPDALNYSEEAKKDNGSCSFYEMPDTYSFTDANGNSTVSYSGQTDRINQLDELISYMNSGATGTVSSSNMKAMFYNTSDNGGGNFSFSSTKRLSDKCLFTDTSMFIALMDSLAIASQSYAATAAAGQAGTLTSGTSTYLLDSKGRQLDEILEKGLMGAVFFYQATNVYFGSGKMDVDNTTPVDPENGEYFTTMEHHWDEAYGYFDAPIDFPNNTSGLRFWAKYCNSRNAQLNCNEIMMNAFLAGRTAIVNNDINQRDAQIAIITDMWEKICAAQAVEYLKQARDNFGSDAAKSHHYLSESYGFIQCLKYAPGSTYMTQINTLLTTTIGEDFWTVSVTDMTNAINELNTHYGF